MFFGTVACLFTGDIVSLAAGDVTGFFGDATCFGEGDAASFAAELVAGEGADLAAGAVSGLDDTEGEGVAAAGLEDLAASLLLQATLPNAKRPDKAIRVPVRGDSLNIE